MASERRSARCARLSPRSTGDLLRLGRHLRVVPRGCQSLPARGDRPAARNFPDERWLDIRRIDVLAPILRARFEVCRRKRFDAVEPDNVDAYSNRSGFPLTADDQLTFNRWVARTVDSLGMQWA